MKDNPLDIKIKHYGRNFANCDESNNCIYIKKPEKEIHNYVDFSVDIINHEFMRCLLFKEIDFYTAIRYGTEICLKVEDRKMLTYEFTQSLYNS